MFTAIDHVVVVVPDLDAAVAAYSEAGFTVVRGGRHNIGTHNALVALADGAYLELIAFLKATPGHPWHDALARGGGIVDFCMQTDDLTADVAALRGAGVATSDPMPMSRERPDGYRLSWVLSIAQAPFNRTVPFLIRDETPRSERVPREFVHSNHIERLAGVAVAVANAETTGAYYAAVLGKAGSPVDRPGLDARGFAFMVGPHRIEVLTPKGPSGPIAKSLASAGPGIYEATLAASTRSAKLEPSRLCGARLKIA